MKVKYTANVKFFSAYNEEILLGEVFRLLLLLSTTVV